ncbi:MAG: DUF502 domain-containing protein [Parachlamydiales bacterium]|nr:DUF502 domain-containing protein [Parachlamydiales bacterium]
MKKIFFTGLVIFLPLAVTVGALIFIMNLLTQPFMGIVQKLFSYLHISDLPFLTSSQQLTRTVSQIVILLGIIIFCFFIGLITRWFLFRTLLRIGDKILHRIPLLNKVYKTIQDMLQNILSGEKKAFQQVVMAPFPDNHGMYTLGLVSRNAPQTCNEAAHKEMLSVFIPTTPNPTTGYIFLYDKKDLIEVDIKTEDAVKYIVSCAMIIPDKKKPCEPS